MRRILVENARRKKSLKHGGDHRKIAYLDVAGLPSEADMDSDDLLALDEALAKLASEDRTLTDLIKLHCFAGLPLVQVADILCVSSRTAERYWAFARAWLHKEIFGEE